MPITSRHYNIKLLVTPEVRTGHDDIGTRKKASYKGKIFGNRLSHTEMSGRIELLTYDGDAALTGNVTSFAETHSIT